jgi:hypothetical protein
MTGNELQQIRKTLCGTDTVTFGRALGLCYNQTDNHKSVAASVRRLESMDKIPEWFAKLASIYAYWKKIA